MRGLTALALGIVAAAALCACRGHSRPVSQINPLHVAHNMITSHLLTVNMGAKNGSRQWGSASIGDSITVEDRKPGIDVEIQLQNVPPGVSEAAALVQGGCDAAPSVWQHLNPVLSGKSKTKIHGIAFKDVKGKAISAVVFAPGSQQVVSCGDFAF